MLPNCPMLIRFYVNSLKFFFFVQNIENINNNDIKMLMWKIKWFFHIKFKKKRWSMLRLGFKSLSLMATSCIRDNWNLRIIFFGIEIIGIMKLSIGQLKEDVLMMRTAKISVDVEYSDEFKWSECGTDQYPFWSDSY